MANATRMMIARAARRAENPRALALVLPRHFSSHSICRREEEEASSGTSGCSPRGAFAFDLRLIGLPKRCNFNYVDVKYKSTSSRSPSTSAPDSAAASAAKADGAPDDADEADATASKDATSELISRIAKQDIVVNKEKPWLWDMGVRTLLPDWKRMFNPSTLLTDVSAGLTVGCVAVPLSLAIAVASGVPPEVGLITGVVSGVAGGLLGGTTLAVTGPAAAISLLVIGAVQEHGLEALPVITLACGGMQVMSGVTRLGVMAKLVPVSVIAGFTTGVGAMILSGQVPKALGLSAPAGLNPLETIAFIGENLGGINPAAAALAVSTSAAMFYLPKLHPKMPSALLAVGGATVATKMLGLDVAVIGSIPSGLEAFKWAMPVMPAAEHWPSLAVTTFLIYAMTSAESLLSCAALEKMKKTPYKHNPDQELIGQGWANVGAGFFLGMPVTSVIARSSLNVKLNAETRLPALVQAGFVFSSVVFFSSTIATIPMPALSGMLITTGIGMLNPAEFKHCFAVQKLDAIPFATTILGMVAFGLAEGIGIGCLSAWALNYDYGKMDVKEINFPHKENVGYYAIDVDPDDAKKRREAAEAVPTVASLQTRVGQVENENVQLQGKVLTLTTDKSELQGRVITLQTENQQLRDRLEAVVLENSELRKLFASMTATLDESSAPDGKSHATSTIGWQLKGPINFASMFKIDDLIHRIQEMKSDEEKLIVLDMQETTSVEFTGVEELVNRLVEVAEQNPGTTIQMWNCHGDLLKALKQCDPKERIRRYSSSDEEPAPFHFPAKEEAVKPEPIPYWYDSPHFRPDAK
jgi:MFS superfamily sulfate permease-like transporter